MKPKAYRSFEFSSVVIAGIAALFAGQSAQAAISTWTGATDGTWVTANNWAPSGVPGTSLGTANSDTVIFNTAINTTVTVDTGRNIKFITFGTGAGAFTLQSGSLTTSANSIWQMTAGETNTETINSAVGLNGSTASFLNNSTTSGALFNFGSTITGTGTQTLILGGRGSGSVSGAITSAGTLGLTKVGTGTWTLSSASNSFTGTLAINGGTLALGTTGALATTTPLNLGGGEISLTGTSAGNRTQTVGALTQTGGLGTITLVADPLTATILTANSLGTRTQGSTPLYRGTNLGTAASGTANTASVIFTTAPTVTNTGTTLTAIGSFASTSGNVALGVTNAPVLRGALVDTSAAGTGIGFGTYDATNGVRLLNASTEQLAVTTGAAYTAAATDVNVRVNSTVGAPITALSITGKATNTLQFDNTNGSTAMVVTNTGSALFPVNGLLFSGTAPITLTGGTLTLTNNVATTNADMVILSTNTAGVTFSTATGSGGTGGQKSFTFGGSGNFTITGTNVSSSSNGGLFVNGPGTVTLKTTAYNPSSAGTVVNGGKVVFGTGFNLSNANQRPILVAAGATLDLGGIQVTSSNTGGFNTIVDSNGAGGLITNTGAAANLGLGNSTNASFSGVIAGAINLVLNKQNVNTNSQTLTGVSTYSGSTTITSSIANAGSLIIGAGGNLPSGTILNLGGAPTINSQTYGVSSGSGILTLGDSNGLVAQTIAGIATAGSGTLNAVVGGNSSISTLTIDNSGSNTFSGLLGGVASNNNNLGLTKTNTGGLILSGANTYVGFTTVTNGSITATTDTALGSGSASTAGLLLNPASGTAAVNFTSSTPAVASLASSGVGSSTIVLGNTATPSATTLTVGANNSATTFAGTISDGTGTNSAAIGNLVKSGSGTLTLSGLNTYTGTTTLNAGVVSLGSAETPGATGPLGNSAAANAGSILFGGGTLQYSAANNNDYSGRFSDTVAQAFSINTNGQTVTFANALGVSSGSPAGSSLTVSDTAGTGSLTTSVDTITGNISVASGATLNLNLTSGQSLQNSFVANGTLNLVGNNNNALMNGGGSVTLTGAGTFNPSVAAGKFFTISGAMSAFSGTVGLGTSAGTFGLNNGNASNTGSTLATFDLGSSTATFANQANAIITIDLGALKATGTGTTLAGNRSSNFSTTYSIGAANTPSTTFAGTITDGTAGGTPTTAITKVGTGTQILSGTNTYTGATQIYGGKLLIGTAGSLASTAVTVGGTSATGTPTLGGGGTIAGATTIAAAGGGVVGTHAPGVIGVSNGVGTQTFSSTLDYGSGSIFEWDLNAASTTDPGSVADALTGTYDQVVAAGAVTGSSAIFKIVLSGNAFTDAFWNTTKTWTNIFTGAGTPADLASIFTTFGGTNVNPDGTVTGSAGSFTFNGSSTLTWSVVPEPTSALAGLLLASGLLRRRRH